MNLIKNVSTVIDNSVSPPTILISNEAVTEIRSNVQDKVYETRYIYVDCKCREKRNCLFNKVNKCNNCCNSINYNGGNKKKCVNNFGICWFKNIFCCK